MPHVVQAEVTNVIIIPNEQDKKREDVFGLVHQHRNILYGMGKARRVCLR